MFIETESTPNPATLKFLPGQDVMGKGTADFPNAEKASHSPLAQALFGIDGVVSVFLGADFISVSKQDQSDWTNLKPQVLGAIMDHFTHNRPVLAEGADMGVAETLDDEVVTKIKELLDTRIRPAVAQDGGDIIFRGFEEGTVYLHMQGACSGCPSSTATLKHGIENMLRYYVPEVQAVQAVD